MLIIFRSSTYMYDVPAYTYTPQPSPRSSEDGSLPRPKPIELPEAYIRRRVDSSLAGSALVSPTRSYSSAMEELPRRRMQRERRGRGRAAAVGARRGRTRSGSESTDESPSPGPVTPPVHEHILTSLTAPRITINEEDDGHGHGHWDAWAQPANVLTKPRAPTPRRAHANVYDEESDVEEPQSPFADADSPIQRAKPFLAPDLYRSRHTTPRHSPTPVVPTIAEDEHVCVPYTSLTSGLGLDLGTHSHPNPFTHHADLSLEDAEDDCLADVEAEFAPEEEESPIRTTPSSTRQRRTLKNMRYALRMRWVAFKLRLRLGAFRARRRVGLV